MSEHVHHIDDADFEAQVLNSDEPVLVDFWAEWCGPCKMISPIVDELAAAYAGKLKVVKVDIDKNQMTPRNYAVRGIPTLMLFKGGKVEATQVGAVSKTQLTQLIDQAWLDLATGLEIVSPCGVVEQDIQAVGGPL